MTTPAPSPPPAGEPVSPVDRRGRRVYILWAIALALLLAAAAFCWAVVVPNRRTHAAILDNSGAKVWERRKIQFSYIDMVIDSDKVVSQLGGPTGARRHLLAYIGQPKWCASAKTMAVYALTACGEEAKLDLEGLCQHREEHVREAAAEALNKIKAAQEKEQK